MTRLGLVTVLYNGTDVLEGFFRSLTGQTHKEWFLEVIDNSPGEETIQRARELAVDFGINDIHFVRNPDNYGVAKGNNQGIRNCLDRGCDYVLLLNNDIEFPPELFSGLVSEIKAGGYDLLAPKVYFFDSGKIWFGGGGIHPVTCVSKHFGEGEDDGPRYSQDTFTEYAPTCFMAVKAEVFSKVGLMDEKYFVYYDDTDFVVRCNREGFRIRYLGNLFLYHKVSSSTGGGRSNFSIYYFNRNRIYFIKKHASWPFFPLAMFWALLAAGSKLVRFSAGERAVLAKGVRDGFAL